MGNCNFCLSNTDKDLRNIRGRYYKYKKKLEITIKKGTDLDDQIFIDFLKASIELKKIHHRGKVKIIQKDNTTIAWVQYNDLDMDTFQNYLVADAFLTAPQLSQFAEDPFKFMLPNTEPNNVYVYGMFESFESDVAPHIIKLYHHGANSITYFGWDFDRKKYMPIDALDAVFTLVKIVSEPALYRDFKQKIKENNNGLYDIESLAYLKSLKRLAAAI
jgi:hypothetical protein